MYPKPKYIKSIFRWNDNKTIDYSIRFTNEHLQIHSIGEKAVSVIEDGKPLFMKGTKIKWAQLPEAIQQHIIERCGF